MKLKVLSKELKSLGYHVNFRGDRVSAGEVIGFDNEINATLVNYWMTITLDEDQQYVLENHRLNEFGQTFSSKSKLIAAVKKQFPIQ